VRVRVPVLALAVAALLAARPAAAEPIGSHLEITPLGGFMLFDPQLRSANGYTLRDATTMGMRVGWQFRPWVSLEAAAGATPSGEDLILGGGKDVNFLHGSGNILLTPWARRAGGPFVSVGFGGARLTQAGADPFKQGTLDVAGGVRLWMTDNVGLRLEARDIHWVPNGPGLQGVDYVAIGGGLTIALGARPRDSDGDGVPDKRDKCPDTPRGARVDANGCPIDSDGDKVFDGLDKCEGTPKGCTVDASGCPSDADGDGVCDGVDQCPDTPKGATVDAKGCPKDSDGDGVLDGLDQCADTPRGCTVDAQGCPKDSDADGVCDGLDKCPDTTPGLKVDKDGCPIELVERETELLDTGMIRLQNVNFATAKADLLPESFPVLDIVGQVLTKWPELRIEIGGHTDARGSDAYNRKLSDARADSVLAYMQRKFPALKPEQFTTKGYGESVPLVPNTSELNWAKNRRVEFVVQNKDVLKREIERRRLLKAGESTTPALPDTTRRPVLTPAPPDTTKR
jgi:outer membrane protein OmpA-like peptidoglycan-associated protein